MADQYTDTTTVLDMVPEFREEQDNGAIDIVQVSRYIEYATDEIKTLLIGRFSDLSIFFPNTPRSVKLATAVLAAIMLLTRHIRGPENNLVGWLMAEWKMWKQRIADGSLLDDAGMEIDSDVGGARLALADFPSRTKHYYVDGARIGVPDFQSRSDIVDPRQDNC